jgi:hypothetical protein
MLLESLQEAVFAEVYSGNRQPFSPAEFLYQWWRFADSLAGYQQQDAHEFYLSLLEGLSGSLIPLPALDMTAEQPTEQQNHHHQQQQQQGAAAQVAASALQPPLAAAEQQQQQQHVDGLQQQQLPEKAVLAVGQLDRQCQQLPSALPGVDAAGSISVAHSRAFNAAMTVLDHPGATHHLDHKDVGGNSSVGPWACPAGLPQGLLPGSGLQHELMQQHLQYAGSTFVDAR